MKYWSCFLLSLFCAFSASANDVSNELNSLDTYIFEKNDLDSAILVADSLLTKYQKKDHLYGIVRANFYLGFIHERAQEYGKSVLYYLEAIRRADETDNKKFDRSKLWSRRNIANIFRKFEANSLATRYNLEGIELAINTDNIQQVIDLKYNQALVYQSNKQFEEEIALLKEILPIVEDELYRSDIINQIGVAYFEAKDYQNAEAYFNQLIDIENTDAKLYAARALHNLGEIHYLDGDGVNAAIDKLYEAIELMERHGNKEWNYSLFISYRNIGGYLFEVGKNKEAEVYLKKAEDISSYADWDVSSFDIYQTLSSLYYKNGSSELGLKYGEIYSNKIENYIETQEELQKKDREYNFDLITQRYFDQVAKQERIASILLYSKITSGTLLALLLLVVGYNRYEKTKLRKSIEQELVSLRIID